MLLLVISVLVAFSVSFLCSLTEAVLFSLTPSQVAALTTRHPTTGALWQRFKGNIERSISVILVLNTTALTVGSAVAAGQVQELFHARGVAVFSAIFTFLMLQFAEILPKTLGVRYNGLLAIFMAPPLDALLWFLGPMVRLIHWINRPFSGRAGTPSAPVSLEEISALAGLARISNLIGTHQEKIILGASRLSRTAARQVMIPIEQVTLLSTSQTLSDAILTAHMDPHTRFPICQADDRTQVVGYVNFKEMIYFMRTNPNEPSLLGIIRPVHFVGPNKLASEMLRVFVEHHVHMAIVQGAEGKALGIVTMEDIVEELVGDLTDEFDYAPRMFHALSGGTWMVGGGLTMPELLEKTNMPLPDPQGTLSAWLLRRMGRLPHPGDIHREGNTEFQIRRIRRGKVFEVSIAQAGRLHPDNPHEAKAT